MNDPEARTSTRPTWTGSLLGFTGAGRPVAGDAEIGIEVASLQGRAIPLMAKPTELQGRAFELLDIDPARDVAM